MSRAIQSKAVTIRGFLFLTFAMVFGGWSAPAGNAQSDEPRTVEVDVPFEMMVPWHTAAGELEDEALMTGTLHVTARTWAKTPGHVDRFALHANAVNIKGTSATTGQRFSVNGSFGYDLRDPEVTFNPDGTFNVPPQPWKLKFHKVDPEPARLTNDVFGSTGATAAAIGPPPPISTPCQRVLDPDGNPTPTIFCGNFKITYFYTQKPTLYRVVSSGGAACTPGTICVVPDGATLFNGETGDYNPPLFGMIRIYTGNVPWGAGGQGAYSVKWHCRVGGQEFSPGTISSGSGTYIGRCDPPYSATLPVEMWAETKFRYWDQIGYTNVYQEITADTTERVFRFKWDRLAINLPPIIQAVTIRSTARVGVRCPIGSLCELNDGDILFNGVEGDYAATVSMEVAAVDPEGDPMTIEWFCKSGSTIYNITNQGSANAQCSTTYNYPNPVDIYVRVTDSTNEVVSDPRQFYFLERLN